MGRRILISIALALGLCAAVAHPVHAVEDYADEIAKQLELADKPSCHYCHAVGPDGVATDTAFADALKTRGFSRRNGIPSLRRALERLDEENVDSDGDGSTDVEELIAAANPNEAKDRGRPAQGCSLSPSRPGHFGASGICLLAACWLGRRSRQGRTRP